MEGITYFPDFLEQPQALFDHLLTSVAWDERMHARKTASFGVAYNYSQISYPFRAFPPELEVILNQIESLLGFRPNNCLINYYLDGQSKMGFHSDQTDILVPQTGVAILSVGSIRTLRFRNIVDRDHRVDYVLEPGSLIYMTQEVQHHWHHAVPKSPEAGPRMSITFRQMIA